jgi:uncharacterized damage-inducible protein DinB
MPTLREQADQYVAGAATLRAAVAGMSREQQIARPVPGKWSTLEVVCHIADFEPVYSERMKRVIALDRPQLLGADERLFASALAYHDRDLEEELAIVETTRRQMARILRTLPESAAERIGVHNERGPKTLAELLGLITGHITHHVPFIAEKRKALGLAG